MPCTIAASLQTSDEPPKRQLLNNRSAQHHSALGAHIEQEVNDAEVGQKAVFCSKNLIIGLRRERGVEMKINLGANGFTKILTSQRSGQSIRASFALNSVSRIGLESASGLRLESINGYGLKTFTGIEQTALFIYHKIVVLID